MTLPQVSPSGAGKWKRDNQNDELENTNDDTSVTAEEILSEICVLLPPIRPSHPSLSHGIGIYWASADADKLFNASK